MGRVFALALLLPWTSWADWPEFRGPTGQGVALQESAPLSWSETENVSWQTDIPGLGWSSPVVFDGEIWLTTAAEAGFSLRALSVDAATGEITRNIEVFRLDAQTRKHAKNSYASPTPIVTEDRVFVHFGSKGTAALDRENGSIIWRNTEHRYEDVHGSGGSPVLWNGLLILNCDGVRVQYVAALEAQSGETIWTADRRASRFSFSTPLVIPRGDKVQVVSVGADMAASYDPATGDELWRITFDGFSVVPRPVFGDGLVYLTTGFYNPMLYAIRVDGSGDVSLTHVAWQTNRGVPLTPSPLLDDGRVYIVSDAGIASCFDASNGRELWRERMPGAYSASPVLANGNVYFTNETGLTTVIESSADYVELARNQIEGHTLASLALADGAVFLRSSSQLYRIED